MNIVEQAEHAPTRCAITGESKGPLLDTGVFIDCDQPRLYLSLPIIEQMARQNCEMIALSEVEKERVELHKRVQDLEKKYENLNRFAEATAALEQAEQVVA